tara:strand:- start:280 stop:885 length:606 start_codon:yes stop_codon:yes gene_type:complete
VKTKWLIKSTGRELFNTEGVMNVTLRDIASKLQRSYGNITYYYGTKEVLINELFDDMHQELNELQEISRDQNLLSYLLKLPEVSFEITRKYVFFTVDHNELKRNFPLFFTRMNELHNNRKAQWLGILNRLLAEGYLKSDLSEGDLQYIMFLSGCVRTAYFQLMDAAAYDQRDYLQTVNALLKPYLSKQGLGLYKLYLNSEL